MGYQESFIQFRNEKILKKEWKKYKERNTENDLADLVCVDRVKKEIKPFKKGELVLVVCGERSEQHSEYRLKSGLGIDNVKSIVFIDNWKYHQMAEGRFDDFMKEHFETLSEEEVENMLKEA